MKNNVIPMNHRKRHQFLASEFYLHNREENFEEKLLFSGSIFMSLILPLFISLVYFEIASFSLVLNILLLGSLIGIVRFSLLPYKPEKYFDKKIMPEDEKENIFEIKRAS